jgi:hypothetical protein
MDIFSRFHTAHQVYAKLFPDDQNVDVSGAGEDALSIVVNRVKSDDKPKYSEFVQLPTDFRGSSSSVQKQVQAYAANLKGSSVSLYREFGAAIEREILGKGILEAAVTAFTEIVKSHPGLHTLPEEMEVRIKLAQPAKLIVFSQACGVALLYNFQTREVRLSGFREPSVVTYRSQLEKIGLPIESVEVVEGLVSETTAVILQEPRRIILTERISVYQQTTDDVLDNVIQRLVLCDALDAVQDIILGDDGEIFLCFDPVLEQDEIDAIVGAIKEKYPQAVCVDTPEGGVQWWVVEISRISDTAVEIANTNTAMVPSTPPAKGIIAKKADDTISSIAKEINVDAALAAATGS